MGGIWRTDGTSCIMLDGNSHQSRKDV